MSVNFLGRFLVQEGGISESQLAEAVALQERCNRRLGEVAVCKGVLTREQVEQVFEAQRTLDAPFGEIAERRGFLDRRELDGLLFSQMIGCRHLGECLLMLGHLSREDFSVLLERYQGGQRALAVNVEYLLAGSGENALLCLAWAAVEKAFARFASVRLKIEAVGAPPGCGEFTTGYCIETELAGRGAARLGLAANFAPAEPAAALPDARRTLDHEDVCRVAAKYFVAGLADYGLSPAPARAWRADPAQAERSARGGGALLLTSPRGRMGLWLRCLDGAGRPCRLPGCAG
ncbi:MAG: hypothetical protein HQK81_07110 [Desulfovibrionaceae bacterium]|nr:hypothetical protein [Desulfovibrionaceae bacterium]MBF0513820.1 hypothetical protein [Desulfovibrionaceae bacterium]